MIWFIIGAALGMASLGFSLLRKPMAGDYPIQGFATAAVLGAAIFGTVLWLIFG